MSDNKNTGMQFKFGTKKAFERKTAASGVEYADYALDAGKFTVYGRAFDAAVINELERAAEGDKIRVGGFVESNTVTKDDGSERTYLRLMTRWVRVNEDEPVKAAKKEAASVAETAESEAVPA